MRAIVTCFTLTRADQSQQHEIRRILTNEVLNYGKENELGVLLIISSMAILQRTL